MLSLILCLLLAAPLSAQQNDPFRPGAQRQSQRQPQDVIASVEFVGAEITDVFKMISDLTGWSVVMSPELSTSPPRINIWVKNLTPDHVLEQIAMLGGIIVDREGTIVRVMTFDEYAQRQGLEKRVVPIRNSTAAAVAAALQPFISEQGSRVLADETSNQVVLLAPEPLLASLRQLVERLDVPLARDEVRLVQLEHLEAAQIIPVLEPFLAQGAGDGAGLFRDGEQDNAGGGEQTEGEAPGAGERWLVHFMIEHKLNLIVLRGLRDDVNRAAQLIEQLDVSPDLRTVGYQLEYTNAEEAFQTLETMLDDAARRGGSGEGGRGRRLRIAASEQNNRIVVEGSARDHRRIAELIKVIDQPLPPGTGGFRLYRLENASAEEAAEVLQRLIEDSGPQDGMARRERGDPDYIQRVETPVSGTSADAESSTDQADGSAGDVLPVRITAAPEINAVLIRASAAEQEEFAALIEQLDYPRDQVLLEVTLVSVRSDDGFRLGLEMAGARVNGVGTELIGLSSFGIASVDSATGQLQLADPPPFGGNLGMFSAGDFSLVLNALRSVGETRITSSPRVLVQDNSPAVISQINQEPFETLSQSDGTLVTSFGGFVDAGTQLAVTPHLSEDDWLRLEYEVNLSSFGTRTAQQLAGNLPPPRRQSASSGTVRIPTDHMVVLGGLRSTNDREQEDRVPVLGDIPVLGELFKSRRRDQSEETLYIFIRPVVLRDLDFQDLIHLSAAEAKQAQIVPESPSNPLKLRLPNDPSEWHE